MKSIDTGSAQQLRALLQKALSKLRPGKISERIIQSLHANDTQQLWEVGLFIVEQYGDGNLEKQEIAIFNQLIMWVHTRKMRTMAMRYMARTHVLREREENLHYYMALGNTQFKEEVLSSAMRFCRMHGLPITPFAVLEDFNVETDYMQFYHSTMAELRKILINYPDARLHVVYVMHQLLLVKNMSWDSIAMYKSLGEMIQEYMMQYPQEIPYDDLRNNAGGFLRFLGQAGFVVRDNYTDFSPMSCVLVTYYHDSHGRRRGMYFDPEQAEIYVW